MVRTSLVLPDTLHQRLLIFARQENIPISRFILDILDKALTAREQVRMKRMYEDFHQLESIADEPIPDASTTIDEILYGKTGAWRGHPKE